MATPSIKLFAVLLIILFILALAPVNPTWAGNPQQTIPTMPPDTETPTITNTPGPTNTLRPGETRIVPPSSTPLPPGATPPTLTPLATATTGPAGATPTNSVENAITLTAQLTTGILSTATNPVVTSTIIGLSADTVVPTNPSAGGASLSPTPGNAALPPAGGLDWKWLILIPVVLVLIYLWNKSRPKVKK
jgi:hypothetical protein